MTIDIENKQVSPMVEIGDSGLKRWSSTGLVYEEYDPKLQGSKGRKIYQEMSESDSTVGAVLFAIRMTLRDVEWSAEPGGEAAADKKATEWLDSCREDMSHTWNAFVSEILSMLVYGWAWFEIVYKKRLGPDADPPSQFDDGAIGWRKFGFRAQDTLDDWIFDERGGVRALVQLPPPDFQTRTIPIEKSLLFTTQSFKGSPEGRSVLRSAFRSWYFRKNLETLEGIALERQGAGFPVWTLPEGASVGTGSNTDETRIKTVLRRLRNDQEAGIIEPFGHKFRFENPGTANMAQYDVAIGRHKKDIAMSLLADFLMLGLDRVGSYALVQGKKDFFSLALGGWLQMIAEVLNRYAVPRLFALNPQLMRGLTALPKLTYTEPGNVDLPGMAAIIEKAAGAGILTPDPELEDWFRQLVRMPERPKMLPVGKPEPEEPVPAESEEGEEAAAEQNTQHYESNPDDREGRDPFTRATNDYQKQLTDAYDKWSRESIKVLQRAHRDGVTAEHLNSIVDGRMEDLGVNLKAIGRRGLLDAWRTGLGEGREPSPADLSRIGQRITENERFIMDSLVPDARTMLQRTIVGNILGDDAALRQAFEKFRFRPAQYAGAHWNTIIEATGVKRQEREQEGKGGRIRWALDPSAEHCGPSAGALGCTELGGRVFERWDDLPTLPAGRVTCRGQCRCNLEEEQEDGSWKRMT